MVRSIRGGGMARLTLSRGPEGKDYVLRELSQDLILKPRFRRCFINGMRIREALSPHPYILESRGKRVYRLVPYEVIDYISGGSLAEMISGRHPEVQNHHLDILRQLSSALAHMHNRQMVHLDVKAENILVEADSRLHTVHIRLTDFDLTQVLTRRRRKVRAGTAGYMAPEQLNRGRVDYGNDIFAFGVVAYYLVSGKMPFSGFSPEHARRVQADPRRNAVPIGRLCSGLAARLERIIMDCLEKEPVKRFPSMAYLEQELRRV